MTHPANPEHVRDFLVSKLEGPMHKSQLVELADASHADEEVLRALRTLPERIYADADAVGEEVAHGT